jgi:hypothetical protein
MLGSGKATKLCTSFRRVTLGGVRTAITRSSIRATSVPSSSIRLISFDSINKMAGQFAADTFIESMSLNSRAIVSSAAVC